MKNRILGRTGIEVSEVAFGGVEIGMPYANCEMPTESDAIRMLHHAIDLGINFFDTARSYGRSELLMGRAFKHKRSQVVISTKTTRLLTEQGDLPHYRTLEAMIDQSLNESLDALDTDYIDIYFLHCANEVVLRSEPIADKLTSLKKSGKIRAIGISTYQLAETNLGIDQGIWDVIQLPFNLMNQQHGTIFHEIQEANLGMVIRSVLCRGILSGHPQAWHPALVDVEKWYGHMANLVKDLGVNLPSLAIKFALSYPEVASVLVGIDKMDYLHEAVEAVSGSYLNAEFLTKLETMAYPDPAFLNLHDWDKNGWLK